MFDNYMVSLCLASFSFCFALLCSASFCTPDVVGGVVILPFLSYLVQHHRFLGKARGMDIPLMPAAPLSEQPRANATRSFIPKASNGMCIAHGNALVLATPVSTFLSACHLSRRLFLTPCRELSTTKKDPARREKSRTTGKGNGTGASCHASHTE
jgi:hypothetical protein